MERSPLNMPRRFRGPSQAPYTRKSLEHANDRGYHAARYEASQRLPVNNDSQPRGSDFIPLNVSAPVTRLERRSADWRNPASWRDNSSPRGWYNHRGSSRGSPRGNCGNRYSSHKNFHMQNRRVSTAPPCSQAATRCVLLITVIHAVFYDVFRVTRFRHTGYCTYQDI